MKTLFPVAVCCLLLVCACARKHVVEDMRVTTQFGEFDADGYVQDRFGRIVFYKLLPKTEEDQVYRITRYVVYGPHKVEYTETVSKSAWEKASSGDYNPDSDQFGQERDETIVDYNEPPSTQPSLWLGWIVNEDRVTIEHDGGEKFYGYIEWIKYLIDKILKPNDYVVNGEVLWEGEDGGADVGKIVVTNNEVKAYRGRIEYVEEI